jgi:hypothetical protein
MLVFDLPRGDVKERVAAIGCCRMNMPIERLPQRCPIEWVWQDTMLPHTTSNVEQYLRFVGKLNVIPPLLERLIYEPWRRLPTPCDPADFIASIDTFMVEISDLWLMWAGPWSLQQNMLFENFVRPHGEILLPWWVEACTIGAARPETLEQVIPAMRALNLEHWDEVEFVLREFRQRLQDREMLISAVKNLVATYPGRWILVPNIVFDNETSERMDQRRDLRDWLKEAAVELGAEFFDPSPIVARVGKKNAMEFEGANLHHYSESFHDIMSDAYLDQLLNGRTAQTSA